VEEVAVSKKGKKGDKGKKAKRLLQQRRGPTKKAFLSNSGMRSRAWRRRRAIAEASSESSHDESGQSESQDSGSSEASQEDSGSLPQRPTHSKGAKPEHIPQLDFSKLKDNLEEESTAGDSVEGESEGKASEGDAGSEKGSEGDSDADSEAPRQAPAPAPSGDEMDIDTPEPSGSNGSGFTQQPQRQQHHQQQSMNSLDFGGGFNYVQQQPGAMPDMFAADQQQQQQQAAQQASQQQQAQQEQMLMQQSQQQQQQQAVDAKANMLRGFPQICRGQKRWWLASADIPFPKQDVHLQLDEVQPALSRSIAMEDSESEEEEDSESEEVNFCKKRRLQNLESELLRLRQSEFDELIDNAVKRRRLI
jgi:hypothetical protein